MKILLQRNPSVGGATIGRVYIDDAFACYSLEDEIREVEGQPVSEWKIKGATAIPAGTYRVTLEQSQRFGADTPTINDVPGFQYIRMHAGNTAEDTEGCLLLGMNVAYTSIVGGTSRQAVAMIKAAIAIARGLGEEVMIEISNPTGVA